MIDNINISSYALFNLVGLNEIIILVCLILIHGQRQSTVCLLHYPKVIVKALPL